jgi:hypothetical protein
MRPVSPGDNEVSFGRPAQVLRCRFGRLGDAKSVHRDKHEAVSYSMTAINSWHPQYDGLGAFAHLPTLTASANHRERRHGRRQDKGIMEKTIEAVEEFASEVRHTAKHMMDPPEPLKPGDEVVRMPTADYGMFSPPPTPQFMVIHHPRKSSAKKAPKTTAKTAARKTAKKSAKKTAKTSSKKNSREEMEITG